MKVKCESCEGVGFYDENGMVPTDPSLILEKHKVECLNCFGTGKINVNKMDKTEEDIRTYLERRKKSTKIFNELKPCPFCGATLIYTPRLKNRPRLQDTPATIVCVRCPANMEYWGEEEELKELWNTRVDNVK